MAAWLNPFAYTQAVANWWQGAPPEPSSRSCFDGCFVMRPAVDRGWDLVEPLFKDLDSSIKIEKITDDGNCLFRAFSNYLSNNRAYGDIRTSIAEYLGGHVGTEFLQTHIALAIEDHNRRCDEQRDREALNLAAIHETDAALQAALAKLSEESASKKIVGSDAYIERAGQDRFFGGDVEVYAFAQKYEVPVGIYEKRGGVYKCSLACIPNGAEEKRPCILIYNREKSHYDICLESLK